MSFGIRDPIEKSNRLLKEQTIKYNFLKTVYFNEKGRYSVNLPWIEDHAPIPSNFDLAKRRLESTVKKLKIINLYDHYNNVFMEWCENDEIKLVPENDLNFSSHYLPHRPVVKEESTTKIRPVFDASAREKSFPAVNL